MGDTSSLRVPVRDRIPEQEAHESPEGPLRCTEFGPFVDVFVDVFVFVFVDGTRIGTLEVELTLLYQVAGPVAAAPPPPPPSR